MENTDLITVVSSAADELGLPQVSSVVSNPDNIVIQLLALTRAIGATLVSRRRWRFLVRLAGFATTNGQEFYALAEDFGRPIDNTMWDGANRWPMDGPLLETEWQYITRGLSVAGPRMQFRLNANRIQVRPIPTATAQDNDVFYLYHSKWWIYTGGTGITDPTLQADFVNDTDLIVFPLRVMVDGVKLRYLQAKGFDSTAVAQDFQNSLDDAIAGDTGAMKLNLARSTRHYPFIGVWNVPDGNWPG